MLDDACLRWEAADAETDTNSYQSFVDDNPCASLTSSHAFETLSFVFMHLNRQNQFICHALLF